jgi:hypothetical protein
MRRIVEAEARPGYRLYIRFEDGKDGEVDLSSLAGKGVFAPWKDPSFFARVTVDRDTSTVAWPGGLDLCPDSLYHDLTGVPLPGESKTAA